MSKWYAYSGRVEGPFYNTKAEARENCEEDETPRPIHNDVCPDVVDVEGGVVEESDSEYAELSHDELKAEAEARGIAEEIDLRSKASVREALEADDERDSEE